MGDDSAYPIEAAERRLMLPLTESQSIRITARLGVWGSLIGFGSFLAMGTGLGIPIAVTAGLVSAGMIGGGLGIAATGALVVRAAGRVAKRVIAGAVAAVPLGLSIFLLGLDVLLNGAVPGNLLTFATMIILVTGCVLGVLLGSGVWTVLRRGAELGDDHV